MQIAEVKIKQSSKAIMLQASDMVQAGDMVVIDSDKSIVLGRVLAVYNEGRADEGFTFDRIATAEDIAKSKELDIRAEEMKNLAKEITRKYNEDMKIVDAEFSLDGGKIMIYFVADDRVDFRDLVKELAAAMKLRIELRQIGIRDQAKMIGCMGVCGKECCCKQYLSDFDKVSIKMAKTQNLSLNPTKISGTCGRLMCCLAFENETYSELCSKCPKVNACVCTPDGKGTVVSNNILKQTVLCRIEKGDEVKVAEYPLDRLNINKNTDNSKIEGKDNRTSDDNNGKIGNESATAADKTAQGDKKSMDKNKPSNAANSDVAINKANAKDNTAKERGNAMKHSNDPKARNSSDAAEMPKPEKRKKGKRYKRFANSNGGQA